MNQLVSASEADPDRGFMARMMVLCSLPRTNPGNRLQYKRVNGPYTLYMTVTGGNKLPFGNLPRLLLAWVSTEVVKTQSRELVLGRNRWPSSCDALGINSTSGGARGEQTRLRNQMRRLFNCTVQLSYKDEQGEAAVNSLIARPTRVLVERAQARRAGRCGKARFELGEDFFNEIINHPVPLDMNTLTALKRCALGLDLYLWLVYRTFALRAPLRLSWQQVYRQFGVDPAKASDKRTVDAFRTKCLRELKKIKLAWPKLNYATAPGLLILHPSTPAIAPLNQAQLTS